MIERKFVNEALTICKLDDYLRHTLQRVGYVGVDIQKTPIVTRVTLTVEKPGLVIGKKGKTIKDITDTIEHKFGFENVQIKVDDVRVPELSAAVMAKRIAASIEKGINFRRVMHFAIDKIMAAGALGAEIVIGGKIVGKGGKAKSERVAAGYIKKSGEYAKLVQVAQAQAMKKAGIIGIVVKIVPPTVKFPDKAVIEAPKEMEEKIAEEKKVEEVEKAVEEKPKRPRKKGTAKPRAKRPKAEPVKEVVTGGNTQSKASHGTGPQ